ncbi:MAG: aminopeptidase [Deltaproteobacteria bacterium]|nr:aminopeptidase [Deltaproteobacteria bacterium]
MNRHAARATLVALFALGLAPRAAADAKVDARGIAERIVGEASGIKEGDLVLVEGQVRDLDLVEELSLAVARRGAHPLQTLGRERTGKRYYTEVPEKYDAARASFALKLVESLDAYVSVQGLEDPGLYRDVPASRIATVGKGFVAWNQRALQKGLKQIYVGNGLYPTEGAAKLLGLTRAELSRLFWTALATPPAQIQANGAAVLAALAGARQVRVTHPSGTDLRFGIEGRPVVLSDGAITPERAARGGAAAVVYLPAGEAMIAPVAGTAEGTVVFDRVPFGPGAIEKLRWTFQKGRLTAHQAAPGAAYTRWKELYEAAGDGKDLFAGIDFGLHPNARAPGKKVLLNFIPAGMVTLALGDDTSLGGSSSSTFGTWAFLPGATVEVDGKVLVEKGALRAAAR